MQNGRCQESTTWILRVVGLQKIRSSDFCSFLSYISQYPFQRTVRCTSESVLTDRIHYQAHREDKLSDIITPVGNSTKCSRRFQIFTTDSVSVHQPCQCNYRLHISLLTSPQLSPDYVGIELGIGESLLVKAIAESTGRSQSVIKAELKDEGDLGLVAMVWTYPQILRI